MKWCRVCGTATRLSPFQWSMNGIPGVPAQFADEHAILMEREKAGVVVCVAIAVCRLCSIFADGEPRASPLYSRMIECKP